MPAKNKFNKEVIRKYLRYIIFTTNILAILLLILSTLAWTVLPSKVTFIAYLGLGFPFILALNVSYLILWSVLLRWKLALVQLIALLFCWDSISTYFPVNSKTKEIPESSFKVLSYNVRGFNWITGDSARNNPIFDYITNSNADIICLQEFVVAQKKTKNGIISEAEFNKIMKDYPYHSIIRLGNAHSSYKYGIACYSKFPIEKSAQLPIESTYNGSAIHEIKIKGRMVTLVNNHLESNRITAEDKKLYSKFFRSKDKDMLDEITRNIKNRLGVAYLIREKQANIIRTYMDKQETDATIVCGDFNDTPISYAYHTIKGDLIDSFAHTGLGQGITYNENKFWFRIDYIMHSMGIESYNSAVGKVGYSDHYPIWTYLKFK
ncbi:endonuclease/exonuclease/phosphatase family protein [Dysgonomonas sp. ZJ279]|uniref:endonuclease/exonuclease/phosphatase family protein n=1 Tax=Dysgonomonas sp. ZJ279 TaxID=2709796 RepID=UPI0013EA7CC5|nr:endonuclease/exonuclease/phosphatase family protein [Dysgonomonas sp. ZJ279]